MRVFAPAKVNLALHVTGRRADDFHLLDSLVVFAGVGDWLSLREGPELALRVTGPRSEGVPWDSRNIVWKAAKQLGASVEIELEKHLPHAAGIGGGSADAAAVLRALGGAVEGSEVLGADVPVCVRGTPARMRGIGEMLEDVPELPQIWIVLVNPGVEVPTGAVFGAMESVENGGMSEPEWADFGSFIAWLGKTRNDMQAPAQRMQPVIGEVLERLSTAPGCAFARMSGSGATCFGLFEAESAARAAAAAMPEEWWSEAAEVLR